MRRVLPVFLSMFFISGSLHARPGDVLKYVNAPGKNCTGLTFDGKKIWVADHALDELLAIDPQTGKVHKRLKSPGYRPGDLAFDGQQLWNVDVKEAQIYRIRPQDGVVTRTVPSPVEWPRALAFDGEALWVSDDKTRSIHRVDPLDGTTIREVPFPSKSVDGLAFDGRYLWVADRLADKFFAVHTPTGEVVATLKSPGRHPTGLGYNGKELVNVDYQSDKIYTVRRDDKQFTLEEDPRDAWVVFMHQVRNFGPDPLPNLDVYLAVPRDLTTQQLLAQPGFEPAPAEFLADQWGQKVARFSFKNVAAASAATVRMKVHLISKTVHWVIYPENVQSLWKIPADVRRRYLADSPKYDVKNPVIKQAVKESVGTERNPYWIARKIYRHIHQKMHYERVGGWDVAPKVLQRGSGSCSEYSYVFISMCRAAGLPARYVGSLVVRKDDASYDDVYHRWAEVYLPPYGWVPVDPSRGDKPTEAERADSFGHLYHDFLITTHGGGGSNLLDWNYNHNHRFSCKGRCKVDVEGIAEWSSGDPDK